jgi:hypothetical protein
MNLARFLFLAPLVLLLAGCDENDAVSIRIRLKEDGTGTMTTSGLLVPPDATRIEGKTQGVTYEKRVQVSGATGHFAALAGVAVADIVFSGGEGEGGFRFVKITLPQGAAAQWPDAFVPLDERTRLDAAGAIDPSGKSKDIGANLKIEIELPAPVVGNGATGKVRGTKNTVEGSIATLIVPIQGSRQANEPLVWHLTWQK